MKVIIAGNWKMNKTCAEAKQLAAEVAEKVRGAQCEVVLCVPYTDIAVVGEAIKGTCVKLGAQNAHWADKGAFTGEISTDMLKELGVEYVILGHSERRQYFGETDATVLKRALAVLNAGMKPIICVGEKLEERESGDTEKVLKGQLTRGLAEITPEQMSSVTIAYEPIWAIGTGKTATANQANDTIAYIRSVLAEMYGAKTADNVTIQYGGSMNEKNAAELLAMPHINGGLIGGAALVAEKFETIVKAASL